MAFWSRRQGVADVDVGAKTESRADFFFIRQSTPIVAGEVDISTALDHHDGISKVISKDGVSVGITRVQDQLKGTADACDGNLFWGVVSVDGTCQCHVGQFKCTVVLNINITLCQQVSCREDGVVGYRDFSVTDEVAFIKEDSGARVSYLDHPAERAACQRGSVVEINGVGSADNVSSRVVHSCLGDCNRFVAATNGATIAEEELVIIRTGDDQFTLLSGNFSLVGHISLNVANRITQRGQCQALPDVELAVGVAQISTRAVSSKTDGSRTSQGGRFVSKGKQSRVIEHGNQPVYLDSVGGG